MIGNVNNLRKLIAKVESDEKEYAVLTTHFGYLMKERIKVTQNSLRAALGRPEVNLDKAKILDSVKTINEIATDKGVDFHIDEEWSSVEAFLRLSIMEDIAGEFDKQANR